jgi:hypothetical protein
MNPYCSMFSQILQLFSRFQFQKLVQETKSERHARGFSSWSQFVAMLFCQLGRAHSLREISGGLRSCEGKLKHLGIQAPSHSTLAYANEHRPWELYQMLFQNLLERCHNTVKPGQHKFRFKNKLLSLDSTTIDLCLSVFDWARFRRAKGAVKLHLLLDHDGYLPSFAVITEGKTHDLKVAHQLYFDPNTIVVDDRGYVNYALYSQWTSKGVYFVTRLKRNALYAVIHNNPISWRSTVIRDQTIQLKGIKGPQTCPYYLRRIEYWDKEKDEVLVFLTNHLKLAANTIAAIYKDRWQIEVFFRALKQNLNIKTFVGTSANAVKIQIWTALIAMLLLRYLQLRSKYKWSLSNLVALLRMSLFTHKDLWAWLDKPFGVLENIEQAEQMTLGLT